MKANIITIRDLCPIITSELRITFDEDPDMPCRVQEQKVIQELREWRELVLFSYQMGI